MCCVCQKFYVRALWDAYFGQSVLTGFISAAVIGVPLLGVRSAAIESLRFSETFLVWNIYIPAFGITRLDITFSHSLERFQNPNVLGHASSALRCLTAFFRVSRQVKFSLNSIFSTPVFVYSLIY